DDDYCTNGPEAGPSIVSGQEAVLQSLATSFAVFVECLVEGPQILFFHIFCLHQALSNPQGLSHDILSFVHDTCLLPEKLLESCLTLSHRLLAACPGCHGA